jgi:dihydroorotase-like cyclic amidohydrolase
VSSSVDCLLYIGVTKQNDMKRLIRRYMDRHCRISVMTPGCIETLDIVFESESLAERYGRNLVRQHICNDYIIVKN